MRHITRQLDYRTMAIRLLFFSAIRLLEYRISGWRNQEIIELSILDLGLSLSDYRI
jgi:hypothetical protein